MRKAVPQSSPYRVYKKRIWWSVAALLLFGSLFFALFWLKNAPASSGRIETANDCRFIETAYLAYFYAFAEYPSTDGKTAYSQLGGENPRKMVMAVFNKDQIHHSQMVDRWLTPFRISYVNDKPVVCSAGADRIFATEDDISRD